MSSPLYSKVCAIFWPKILRQKVDELHEAGKLNYTALVFLEDKTPTLILPFVIFGLLFVLGGKFKVGALTMLFGLLCPKFDMPILYRRCILPYLRGEVHEFVVDKFYNLSDFRKKIIGNIPDLDNRKVVIIIPPNPKFNKDEIPKEGDVFRVYVDIENKYRSMPDILSIKKDLCLDITKFQENEKQ